MKRNKQRYFLVLVLIGFFNSYVFAQTTSGYEQWKIRQESHDQRLKEKTTQANFQQRVVQVESRTPLPIMTVAKSPQILGNELSININTASLQEITAKLDGIGRTKAQAIIAYRDKNGHFKRKEDLLNVKGIGVKTLEKNSRRIRLN